MNRFWSVVPAMAICAAAALPASADERKFTYSNEAKTLPAGVVELEQWVTLRARKEAGTFRVWKIREELEYGFTDRFTGALYLNWELETVVGVPGRAEEHESKFEGVSLEGKYKFTDPSADPVGLLLYAELTAEENEYEVELKGVASKALGDWTFVYNFVFEAELKGDLNPSTARRRWEREYLLQNTAGISWSLLPPLAVGLEAMTRTPVEDGFHGRGQTAFFIGPNAHVAVGPLWATLTLLFQVDPQGHNDLNLDEFTKYEVRLIAGFNF